MIVFHGDRDAIVHPSNGQSVYRQFTQGASVRKPRSAATATPKRGAGRDGKVVAEHWTLHGAGHAWSGGSSGRFVCREPSGPNASAEMLRFFLSQH
jgi:poly(3-hydroxybutyrate) depolymerase